MAIRKLIRRFIAIVCILMLTRLASAAPDTASIKTEIVGMPVGTSIEFRSRTNKHCAPPEERRPSLGLRLWMLGPVNAKLPSTMCTQVKHVRVKSHPGRNILIGVGIGVGAVAIVIVALAKHGGYL